MVVAGTCHVHRRFVTAVGCGRGIDVDGCFASDSEGARCTGIELEIPIYLIFLCYLISWTSHGFCGFETASTSVVGFR